MAAGSNMVTTIIGFVLSAVFIVFVCTKLFCGRLRRAEPRPIFELDAMIDVEQPRHQFNGLEPVLVAEIPTTKFSRDTFGVEDAQCSICLGEYQEKEVLRIMPKCGHIFHLSCIDVWLRKQSTCPVCRLPLKDSVRTKDALSIPVGIPHRLQLPTSLEHPEGSRSSQAEDIELAPTNPQESISRYPETSR